MTGVLIAITPIKIKHSWFIYNKLFIYTNSLFSVFKTIKYCSVVFWHLNLYFALYSIYENKAVVVLLLQCLLTYYMYYYNAY